MKKFCAQYSKRAKRKSGFAIMFALIIGTVMLILAVSLFSFVGHQHTGIQNIVNGEVAHFLAEAGINSCIGTVREAISRDLDQSAQNSAIRELLFKPGTPADVCINNLLGDSWNAELEKFAREVDEKDAEIRVEVWLRNMKLSETNTGSWSDPISKEGWLAIESVAHYKNSQRTLAVRRNIRVSSILPGPMSKFTLFAGNASRNGEAVFNLIRNDYRGTVTDGPKPLICYNHATSETPLSSANFGDILEEEKDPQIWKKRGWIYLGPKKVRLNLCSGAGKLGEIFHFYDVSNTFQFNPVKFATGQEFLPQKLRSAIQIPWDLSSSAVRNVSYSFGHSFILDGFHDRSNRKESEAMYEGNVLSAGEKAQYSSKSSILHLYGDARKGFQSRTKVFGPVVAAFPRFASLEITPEEPDVKAMFDNLKPPPLYLIHSKSENSYDNSIEIKDVLNRKFGGPLLKSGMICENYADYRSIMSRITELPYVSSYNSMQEVYSSVINRTFPPVKEILKPDNLSEVTVESSEGHLFFKGSLTSDKVCGTLAARVHNNIDEISEFWEKFVNEDGELELNQIVRIRNKKKLDFMVPPPEYSIPMQIKGGGMVILENGNLMIRGIKCSNEKEALTIVAPSARTVSFPTATENHLNLVAPEAELSYGSRINLLGTLCIGSIFADHRFQGGAIRFRTDQDPANPGYQKFYKVYLDEVDSYWHE
jgi:hypothetical protein